MVVDDKDRIDWLEANPEFYILYKKKKWSIAPLTSHEFNIYKTLREAIDAAMDGSWKDVW